MFHYFSSLSARYMKLFESFIFGILLAHDYKQDRDFVKDN